MQLSKKKKREVGREGELQSWASLVVLKNTGWALILFPSAPAALCLLGGLGSLLGLWRLLSLGGCLGLLHCLGLGGLLGSSLGLSSSFGRHDEASKLGNKAEGCGGWHTKGQPIAKSGPWVWQEGAHFIDGGGDGSLIVSPIHRGVRLGQG